MDEIKALRSWRITSTRLSTIWSGMVSFRKTLKSLPELEIHLTPDISGKIIREYIDSKKLFSSRKSAACVLVLPEETKDYISGRSKQSLRTNIRKADTSNLRVYRLSDSEIDPMVARAISEQAQIKHLGALARDKIRIGVKNWVAVDAEEQIIGFARIQTDRDVAMIKCLVSIEDNNRSIVRWKLSYDIFAECIQSGIKYVICDSLFELDAGKLYFQERLGFKVFRLRTV